MIPCHVRVSLTVLALCFAVLTPLSAQEQTATDFYMSYRQVLAKAKVVEDLLPHMSKETRAKVEAMPKDERPMILGFVQEMSKMTGLKVVKEEKTAGGVTLTVEGMQGGEKMTGRVQIVKEDGTWKMGRESWSNKS